MDREALIRELEADGDFRVLRRYQKHARYCEEDGSDKKIGLILDVETTGLDPRKDIIIELGMVTFEYCPRSGRIYRILDTYDEFNDPGQPIPPAITRLTGITDEMVAGRHIDLDALAAFIEPVDLVISHNANFDRKFAERLHPPFSSRPWACSVTQINWDEEGIGSRKLDYIACKLGFYFDHHRAENDCLATLHMLSYPLPVSGRPALLALLETARQLTVRLYAVDTRFEMKDLLKERGYGWNDGSNGKPRAWNIEVPRDRVEEELDFLRTTIYKLPVLNLPQEELNARNRFSERS